MASPTPPKSNVLLVLFPGFNTLDMNGPYEVLQRSADASVFTVTVASETDITTSVEGVQVKVSSSSVPPPRHQRLINRITF
jgi:putative intracellular protease/amidase